MHKNITTNHAIGANGVTLNIDDRTGIVITEICKTSPIKNAYTK